MAVSQKLAMKQGQSLVMTPQLSQSIKLLALSNIELSDFVKNELENNPFLEKPTQDRRSENPSSTTQEAERPETLEAVTGHHELETSAKALSENLGTSLENVFPDEADYARPPSESIKSKESYERPAISDGLHVSATAASTDQAVADYTANPIHLRDHLLGQLSVAVTTPQINLITADLIDNLDEAGYLSASIHELTQRLGCEQSHFDEALTLLQSFEPLGVGARSLSECLSIQLKDKGRFDPAMEMILDNLDLLAKRDFDRLQSLSDLDMEDLHDALLEIKGLNPKPGTAFESTPLHYIAPDIFVRENTDGSWAIELNTQTLPRVLINNVYAAEVTPKLQNEKDKDFLSQCLQTAHWLTKSLDQRAQTILKVTKEIVKQQDDFLLYGVHHLRPLTLRMVADAIDMHESTVSRVTSNKYMMTPRGLFELKYFFTTGIANSAQGGENHSSESVKAQIRQLIDDETIQTMLSDDALVIALKNKGIDIARRTVAKYREAMHIPSSVQRRREKKALEAAQKAKADG